MTSRNTDHYTTEECLKQTIGEMFDGGVKNYFVYILQKCSIHSRIVRDRPSKAEIHPAIYFVPVRAVEWAGGSRVKIISVVLSGPD
jgi:hypothetical protein